MFRNVFKKNTATSMILKSSIFNYLQKMRFEKEKKGDEAKNTVSKFSQQTNLGIVQRNLGYCYENGIGVKIDHKLAFEFYQKAVSNGNIDAYADLWYCYLEGAGVEKNQQKKQECLQKIINENSPAGIYSKAWCYETNSCSYSLDYTQADALFEQAANQGYARAQHYFACLQQNEQLKLHWFQKAADQGYIPSTMGLAYLYRDGSAEIRDKNKAIEYFQKAIKAGKAEAEQALRLTNLGRNYTQLHLQRKLLIQSKIYEEGGACFGGAKSGEFRIESSREDVRDEFNSTSDFQLQEDRIVRYLGQEGLIVIDINTGNKVSTFPKMMQTASVCMYLQRASELANGKMICAYENDADSADEVVARTVLWNPKTNNSVSFANYLPRKIEVFNHLKFVLLNDFSIEVYQCEETKSEIKSAPKRLAYLKENNNRKFLNVSSLADNEFAIGYDNGDLAFYKLNKYMQLELIKEIVSNYTKDTMSFSKTQFIVASELNKLFVLQGMVDYKETPTSEPCGAYVLDSYDLNTKERIDSFPLFKPSGKMHEGKLCYPFETTITRLLPDNKNLIIIKRASNEAWLIDLEARMVHPVALPYAKENKKENDEIQPRLHYILKDGRIIHLTTEAPNTLAIYVPHPLLEYAHNKMQPIIKESIKQTLFGKEIPHGLVKEITDYVGADFKSITSAAS